MVRYFVKFFIISLLFTNVSLETRYGHLVKTVGCSIGRYDEPKKYYKAYLKHNTFNLPRFKLNCSDKTKPELLRQQQSAIYIVANRSEQIGCCYRSFYRKNEIYNMNDNCTLLPHNQYISMPNEEFLMVDCVVDKTRHKYTIALIPQNKVTEKLRQQEKKYKMKRRLSILILGIAALSRVDFHRHMPKTADYLSTMLDTTEMFGFNRVGPSAYSNLLPLLTGFSDHEIEEIFLSSKDNPNFYNLPFIWKSFQQKGYVTALVEENTRLGVSIDNTNAKVNPLGGLDFDYRSFEYVTDSLLGRVKKNGIYMCRGTQLSLTRTLKYVELFLKTFKDNLYFLFSFTSSLTAYGITNSDLLDDAYHMLLVKLNDLGAFNNTAVIFLSDRGLPTKRKIERNNQVNLPWLQIYLPMWFRQEYTTAYNNLKRNQHQLITVYDIHQTLLHINYYNEKQYLRLNTGSLAKNRGRSSSSLFHDIPTSRQCTDARISPIYCSCASPKKSTSFWKSFKRSFTGY